MSITWQIESLDQVESTNTFATQRILDAWSHGQSAQGIVIVANRQTAGRGQHGRRWESPPGGLYLSAVVEDIPASARDRLALIAGVAVVEALLQTTHGTISLKIRWPNDVVVTTPTSSASAPADAKIAGILCEALAQGPHWAAIIGIGVNVEAQSFPPELHHIATSLRLQDRQISIEAARSAILNCLANQLETVKSNGLAPIVSRVRELDALRGRRIGFDPGDGTILEGIVEGIDDQGRLLLRHNDGETKPFSRGSVQAVLPP